MLRRSQGFYSGAWCAAALCLVEERATVSPTSPHAMYVLLLADHHESNSQATVSCNSSLTSVSELILRRLCSESLFHFLSALFTHPHLGVHLLGTKHEVSFEFEMLHL